MRTVLLGCALATALSAAGCADPDYYLDRRETVSFGAGDAQQANLVTHAVNPLPPHAQYRYLWFDGERMQGAVRDYREGTVEDPEVEETD